MLPYCSDHVNIDFASLQFIEREEESEKLKAAFEAVVSAAGERKKEPNEKAGEASSERFILIAGKSGCGKTKLVDTLRAHVRQSKGIHISGKFDLLSSTRPYSALVDAITSLCRKLNGVDEVVKSEIVNHLGNDLSLLYTLVPSARISLRTENSDGDTISPAKQSISSWMFLRLKLMTGKLFQAVSKLGPLVLFLDDLQWCDAGSIEIINSVLMDEKLMNFLFVGAYRDDEIIQAHPLFRLDGFSNESRTIQVKHLSEEAVNTLIAAVLNLEAPVTLPLAKEIYRKTAGNCFFVVHLLKLLQAKHILAYSLSTYQWVWDLARITSEIDLAENVAEVVAGKLQTLPFEAQSALAIAACFGNKFDGSVLDAVLKSLEPENQYHCAASRDLKPLLLVNSFAVDMKNVLATAVEEGFVDKLQNVDGSEMTVYKFSHSKIQAVAYDLVKSSDPLRLHALLGKILLTMLPDAKPDQRDPLLFTIVEQLYRAETQLLVLEDESFRVKVAWLNLEAARSVQHNAAFVTAVNYLQSNVALLGGEKGWIDQYQLTLETLNLKAKMELCCRQYSASEQTVLNIFSNATCLEDKIQAYTVWIDCLGRETKCDEILQTVYGVVAHLGFRTPRRKAGLQHVVQQIMQTKRTVKRFSDEELLAYRASDDFTLEGCLRLLLQAASYAYLAESMNDVIYIGMLVCYISLTRGFTKFSGNSFASLALVFAKMGDFKTARRYGRLALEISDRFQAKECDGNTMFLYYSFIHHTAKPMPELLDPLLEAAEIAKTSGDIETSHHACVIYTFTYILCGLPLSAIEKDTANFIDEMQHYKCPAELNLLRLLRQMALNLITRSGDPLQLEGEEILGLRTLFIGGNDTDNTRLRNGVMNCQIYLACYLGRGRDGQKVVARHAKLADHDHPLCFSTFFPYLRGIVLLRLAREGCRGYKRLAAREIRRIRGFVAKGFINCTHLLHILEAGMLSLSKKPDLVVQTAYDKAIACASRSGFSNDAGLASEHAAVYFRHRDQSRSSAYLDRAIDFYQQWEAGAKIATLEEEGGHCGPSEGSSAFGSAIRGRSRRSSTDVSRDYEISDWFASTTAKFSKGRRNLGSRKLTSN